jgi:hypothetical protein
VPGRAALSLAVGKESFGGGAAVDVVPSSTIFVIFFVSLCRCGQK